MSGVAGAGEGASAACFGVPGPPEAGAAVGVPGLDGFLNEDAFVCTGALNEPEPLGVPADGDVLGAGAELLNEPEAFGVPAAGGVIGAGSELLAAAGAIFWGAEFFDDGAAALPLFV